MIEAFENYLKIGKVKRKTPDEEEAKSLLEKSENRLQYTKMKEITDKTSPFVLEDAYEAMREAAQSLMSMKGFKPYSHEATISFVNKYHLDIFNKEEINKLDRFRQLRNDSIYKALPIMQEDAKASVIFATKFIKKVHDFLRKGAQIEE